MGEKRIVVVDDDPSLLRLIAVNLEARGYMPVTFTPGRPPLSHMTYATPDLVILNILMPEIDGIEMVRRIRQVSRVPIVMISAKVEVATKLQALHLGADDYLTKPLGIEELIARVRAILRRSTAPGSPLEGTYHWGDLEVDLDRDEVMRRGRPVKLSAREWAVLRIFREKPGQGRVPENVAPAGMGARVWRRAGLRSYLRGTTEEKVGARTREPPIYPYGVGDRIPPGQSWRELRGKGRERQSPEGNVKPSGTRAGHQPGRKWGAPVRPVHVGAGQSKAEGAALTLLALHPDLSPVGLDYVLDDEEAKPRPGYLSGGGVVGTEELGEQPGPIGLRQADACIRDVDLYVPVPLFSGDGGGGAGGESICRRCSAG